MNGFGLLKAFVIQTTPSYEGTSYSKNEGQKTHCHYCPVFESISAMEYAAKLLSVFSSLKKWDQFPPIKNTLRHRQTDINKKADRRFE